MSWEDSVAKRMRRAMIVRHSLDNLESDPEDIYRPEGMRRIIFRQKIAYLKRLERKFTDEFKRHMEKWIDKRKES